VNEAGEKQVLALRKDLMRSAGDIEMIQGLCCFGQLVKDYMSLALADTEEYQAAYWEQVESFNVYLAIAEFQQQLCVETETNLKPPHFKMILTSASALNPTEPSSSSAI